jgi:uncharacterized damage-inducible protein DinB
MGIQMIQSVYAHASWANRKLFDSAAQLTDSQLTRAAVGSESIFDLLAHIVNVQRNWLARAQQIAPPPDIAIGTNFAALRAAWESVDAEIRVYVDGLSADELTEIVRYTNSRGEPQAYPRWQILLHQALHAAQHRAEAALLLTQLGSSTGWLDYLIFVDQGLGA